MAPQSRATHVDTPVYRMIKSKFAKSFVISRALILANSMIPIVLLTAKDNGVDPGVAPSSIIPTVIFLQGTVQFPEHNLNTENRRMNTQIGFILKCLLLEKNNCKMLFVLRKMSISRQSTNAA